MMNKNGMMVICGNSIEELEADLSALKAALATGTMMACGGRTLSATEQALKALRSAMSNAVAPTANPCGGTCGCQCNGCMTDEEDEDDYPYGECPNCGEPLNEDGYCDSCGYDDACDCEEEEACKPEPLPSIMEMLEALASGDIDRITAMAKRLGVE